jgi:hypothetical protein
MYLHVPERLTPAACAPGLSRAATVAALQRLSLVDKHAHTAQMAVTVRAGVSVR